MEFEFLRSEVVVAELKLICNMLETIKPNVITNTASFVKWQHVQTRILNLQSKVLEYDGIGSM